MAAESEKRITLRVPESLHAILTNEADKELRSLNSQVLHILMNHIALNNRTIPVEELIATMRDVLAVGDGTD